MSAALAGGTLAAAAPAAPAAGTGGLYPTRGGKVTGFECRSACPGIDVVGTGSVVRVIGEGLGSAGQVIFLGGAGTADNVVAPVTRVRADEVDAQVPAGARSGPVTVVNTDGAMSEPSRVRLAIHRPEDAVPSVGSVDARLERRTVFFGSRRKARFTYLVRGNDPLAVRVDLVRVSDGALVARWEPQVVAPGTPQSVTWNGLAGGKLQREGRYEFRLFSGAAATPPPAGSARSAAAQGATAADAFQFLGHIYPIRGEHNYGTYINHFGGGRGHKGEDVLSPCGTPLAAARGGRVVKKWFDGYGGGHTVAIDGERTNLDYVYMHLREPALVEEGDRVWTGQLIGFVGDTGNASTCHLHFELWRGGFWNGGGAPVDPLPFLKAWDRLS